MVLETGVQSQVKSYQRLKKMVLDTAFFNTQHYKLRIKGMECHPHLHLSVLPFEKGPFG